ncbi:MAG: hypothetical protein HYU28_11560 [Actinobacteria bacterium]|nr:hypothetical protein [Actinomycetota bacterium]
MSDRPPRFNHVALSLPPDALRDAGRKEIIDFYSSVFGWDELPTLTEDRKRLVLQAYRYDQFVFLVAEDAPMQSPRMDHFGMAVHSMEQLDELHEKAKRWKEERDDRVDLIEKHADDHGVLKIWSFYVRHLLPMMIEVQFYEIAEDAKELVDEYNREVAERRKRDASEEPAEPEEEPAA